MIDNKEFQDVPEFGSNAEKVKPSDSKYNNGYVNQETFPCENENWFMGGLTKNGVDVQSGLNAVISELKSILSAYGVLLNPSLNNQIITTLQNAWQTEPMIIKEIGGVTNNNLNACNQNGIYWGVWDGHTSPTNQPSDWEGVPIRFVLFVYKIGDRSYSGCVQKIICTDGVFQGYEWSRTWTPVAHAWSDWKKNPLCDGTLQANLNAKKVNNLDANDYTIADNETLVAITTINRIVDYIKAKILVHTNENITNSNTVHGVNLSTILTLNNTYNVSKASNYIANINCNDIIATGIYNIYQCARTPDNNSDNMTSTRWFIEHLEYTSGGYAVQKAYKLLTDFGDMYIRAKHDGTWTSWIKYSNTIPDFDSGYISVGAGGYFRVNPTITPFDSETFTNVIAIYKYTSANYYVYNNNKGGNSPSTFSPILYAKNDNELLAKNGGGGDAANYCRFLVWR